MYRTQITQNTQTYLLIVNNICACLRILRYLRPVKPF